MKAIAFNASPRKKHNTDVMLQHALDGAASAGAETEIVHLYNHKFSGCISCFSCKRIGGKSYGKCAVRDELTPLLEKTAEADVLLLGSPVYLGSETASFRAMFERLIFPYLPYATEPVTLLPRKIAVGLVYTMGVEEGGIGPRGYEVMFERAVGYATRIFGHCERVYAAETLQFDDASKYFCPAKDIPALEKRHTEVFPKDCKKAFAMGKRLAELAKKG